jgi:integrase
MGKANSELPPNALETIKAPGMYSDGGGLYLQISPSGARSWIFRFMLNGKRRAMGLGTAGPKAVTLAVARVKATEARQATKNGTDPIAAREAAKAAQAAEKAKAVTFEKAATQYIDAHRASWRNDKHAAQWPTTLETYANPVFGKLPVSAVDVGHVSKVLEPIWSQKPETARRLRGRIEAVLDWAKAKGFRQGENPARWRGHLENLLPKYQKVARVRHHPALPYPEVGAFIATLQGQDGTAARALEFLILTATRTTETTGARWAEFDLDKAEWKIPGERIKAGKEHRIPLSPRALAIVREFANRKTGEFVFASGRGKKALSNGAFLALLKRMGRTDITAHGFRSTFRDWAAEQTNYPRDVAEMALAHAIGDKVEAAYRRGDLFAKRARMMADWAKHCATVSKGGNVIAINAKA